MGCDGAFGGLDHVRKVALLVRVQLVNDSAVYVQVVLRRTILPRVHDLEDVSRSPR